MKPRCDSCQALVSEDRCETHKAFEGTLYGKEQWGKPMQLCSICYNTRASAQFLYPDSTASNNEVLKTMAYCTNAILEALSNARV